MQKCNICFDEIKTNEFTQATDKDEVDEQDPQCLRLSCGHAYHTNCIINSFRRNEKCPICRKDLVKKEEVEWFELESDDEPREEDLSWILIDTLAKQERCRNTELKEKRKILNDTIKEFHKFHQSLKFKRRQNMKQVLKRFRDDNHKLFRSKVKDVQKCLNIVKKIEKCTVEKSIEEMETPVQETVLQEYFKFNPSYDAASLLTKNDINLNGFSRKFWN